MGSDGTDDPSTFKGAGSYVSGFPVDTVVLGAEVVPEGAHGDPETFGLPTYTSVMVNATAINDGVQGRPWQDARGLRSARTSPRSS